MKKFIILLLMLLITSPVFAKTYIFKYYPNGLLVKIGDMDVIHDWATGRIKSVGDLEFKYYSNGLLVKIGDMDVIHDWATGRIKAITNDTIEEVKKKF